MKRRDVCGLTGLLAVAGCLELESADSEPTDGDGTASTTGGDGTTVAETTDREPTEGESESTETEDEEPTVAYDGWPMARRDPRNSGSIPQDVPGSEPVEAWSTGGVAFRVVASDGTVYRCSLDGDVTAVDADSGERRWTTTLSSPVRARPAVGADSLALTTESGRLVVLDAASGDVRWEALDGGVPRAGVAMDDGTLYGSEYGTLYAFDVRTGEERWSYESGDRIASTPSVSDGAVAVGISSSGGGLAVLDADSGAERWRLEFDHASSRGRRPLIVDGVVVSSAELGDGNGKLAGFDLDTGETVWTWGGEDAPSFGQHPRLVGGVVVAVGEYGIAGVDPATGGTVFQKRAAYAGTTITRPVPVGDSFAVAGTSGVVELIDPGDGTSERLGAVGPTVYDLATDGDRVFAGTATGSVVAVDATSGSREWSDDGLGWVVAQPVVVDGSAYVSTVGGGLARVDVGTGAVDWQVDLGDVSWLSAPAVDDGRLVVVTVREEAGTVHGIDPATGEEGWRADVESFRAGGRSWRQPIPGVSTGGLRARMVASPTIADGTVYVAHGDLAAFDAADGSREWSVSPGPDAERFDCTPTVANGTVYVAERRTRTVAVDAADGTVTWEYRQPATASPAVADGTAYVSLSNGGVVGLDAGDGSERWLNTNGSGLPVAVAEDRLLVPSTEGAGMLHAMSRGDGETVWSRDVQGNLGTGAALTNGTVLVGIDGSIHAFDGTSGEERWRVPEGQLASPPAVATEAVFVASDAGLRRYDSG